MKKIINEYKVFIFIGVLLLIFGVLLLWPQKKENQEKVVENKTKIVGIVQRPEVIEWGENKIVIPEKTKILEQKDGFINGNKLELLLKTMGMAGVKAEKSDSFYVVYRNESSSIYIKKQVICV